MMNIVIDPFFPPKNKSERTHGTENQFELLYSDGTTAANNF